MKTSLPVTGTYTPIRTRFADSAVQVMRHRNVDAETACEVARQRKRLYETYWQALKHDERLGFINLIQRMESRD